VERILAYGPEGSGKTFQLLKIAQWLLGTGAQFYVLDTDDSYQRSMEEFPALPNVHPVFAYDWADYVEWLSEVEGKVAKRRDWLVVDRIDKAWGQVQNWCSEEVHGVDLATRLLSARQQISNKRAMVVGANDQADWQVINAQYRAWFQVLMYRSRANVYVTAAGRAVRNEDDEAIRDTYGPLRLRPEGQKDLPYECSSSFLFHRNRDGQRLISTAKDRGRPYYWNQPLISFPQQYLMAVAGWRNS
jgi:hypothetical protein